MMSDAKWIESLVSLPDDWITSEDIELVAPYLAIKDFQPDKVLHEIT
jgi:hypothetical protein